MQKRKQLSHKLNNTKVILHKNANNFILLHVYTHTREKIHQRIPTQAFI
jgi:hypothetical protein